MKLCPACKTTYTDDSLKFCLSDGGALVGIPDEEPTVIRGKDPLRVNIPSRPEPGSSVHSGPPPQSPPGSMAKWAKILIAVIVLGFAALAAAGLAGAAIYYGMGSNPAPTPTPLPPTPYPSATKTPDLEKERLKDEIANIQKQLDDNKKNANSAGNDDDDERGSAITATVDSPKDGFLALRDSPDADRGERLAKIPHGAEVEIMNCEKNPVTIDGRSGRWCQVEYEGVNGWVFDAWLEY